MNRNTDLLYTIRSPQVRPSLEYRRADTLDKCKRHRDQRIESSDGLSTEKASKGRGLKAAAARMQ